MKLTRQVNRPCDIEFFENRYLTQVNDNSLSFLEDYKGDWIKFPVILDELAKLSWKDEIATISPLQRVGIKDGLLVFSYISEAIYKTLEKDLLVLEDEFSFFSSTPVNGEIYRTINTQTDQFVSKYFGEICLFPRYLAENFRKKYGHLKTLYFTERFNTEPVSAMRLTNGNGIFLFYSKVKLVNNEPIDAYVVRFGRFSKMLDSSAISIIYNFSHLIYQHLSIEQKKDLMGPISQEITKFHEENIRFYPIKKLPVFNQPDEAPYASLLKIDKQNNIAINQTRIQEIDAKIAELTISRAAAPVEKHEKLDKSIEALKLEKSLLTTTKESIDEYRAYKTNTGICIHEVVYKNNTLLKLVFSTSKPSEIKVIDATGDFVEKVYAGPFMISIARLDSAGYEFETLIHPKNYSTILAKFGNYLKIHPHSGPFEMENLTRLQTIQVRPCWGEAYPLLCEAFGNNDVYFLINIINTWLTSTYAQDEWGQSYVAFPTRINEEK